VLFTARVRGIVVGSNPAGVLWKIGTAGRKGWIVGSGMAGDQRNTVGAIIVKSKFTSAGRRG
jgi:hypothetical protein